MFGFRNQPKQRKAERSSVLEPNSRRNSIIALDSNDGLGTQAIVSEEDISQAQDEDADLLICKSVRHGLWVFFVGTNLYPEKMESNVPICSMVEDRKTK